LEPYQPILDAVAEHDDFRRQLTASKLSPLIPLAPAIWSCWKGRARMPLWQAAALSTGFEPVYRLQSGNFAAASLAAECGLAIEAERYTETPLLERLRCDMDFSTRLALLTDRLGGAEMDESHPVKIADVLAVALDMGWSVPDEFKVLAGDGAAPSASMPAGGLQVPEPLQRQRHQEGEILRVLRELGYDPAELPARPHGKSGAKAAAWGLLAQKKWSRGVFDKAWDRLRGAGEIVGG
jgi:hypothetical protein